MTDRRKQRHTAGWILVFLLGCDLALLFFTLFYRFGLYNPTGLAEAFETGGYYEERETAMEERFRDCLLSAGLPEDFLSFEDYRDTILYDMKSDEFEEKLQEWAGELSIEENTAAVNKHDPKHLKDLF